MQTIKEARSAPLYHVLGLEKLIDVLEHDRITPSWSHLTHARLPDQNGKWGNQPERIKGTSLTRNPRLLGTFRSDERDYMLEFDQEKLNANRQILPLDADLTFNTERPRFAEPAIRDRMNQGFFGPNEKPFQYAEEFLIGDLPGLHKYLTTIYITDRIWDDEKNKKTTGTVKRQGLGTITNYLARFGNIKVKLYPSRKDITDEVFDKGEKAFKSTNWKITQQMKAPRKQPQLALTEGINDKGTFKIIFMAGGTGSGKDFLMNRTITGLPMKEINSDTALEMLMKRDNMDFSMPVHQELHRAKIRDAAKRHTQQKLKLAFDGRLGLIINGTGGDPDKIKLMKDEFEKLGYESMMVFAQTSNDVSRKRNELRGQLGGRKVPEHIRQEKWDEATKSIDTYKKLFGDSFVLVDTDKDAINGTEEEKAAAAKDHIAVFRQVKNFVEKPVKNHEAKHWYDFQFKQRGLDINKFFKKDHKHPTERRWQTLNTMIDHIDYARLSNYSLAQRKRYGDEKAANLLAARERAKAAYE